MPASANAVELAFVARLAEFRKEIAKMPQAGQKEAKKLVDLMEKEYKRNEKLAKASAEKAAKAAEKAAEKASARAREMASKQLDGIKGVGERTASLLGGIFGDLGDIVFDLTERFGQTGAAIGGVGGALVVMGGVAAAGAGALGLVLTGLRSIADGALEARDRLAEVEGLYGVPPESLDQLRDYEVAGADLRMALDELQVVAGGELAEDLAVLARNLALVTRAGTDLVDKGDSVTGFFRGFSRVVSLGLLDPVYAWADGQYEAADAAIELERAAQDETEQLKALGIVIDDVQWGQDQVARKAREAAEAEREAARAVREYQSALREGAAEINDHRREELALIKRRDDANTALADMLRETTSDQLSDEDKVRQAYRERIALLDQIAVSASDNTQQARLEAELRLQRDLAEIEQKRAVKQLENMEKVATQAQASAEQLVAALDAMAAEIEEAAAERIAKLFSNLDAVGSVAGSVAGLLETLHSNTVEDIRAEAAARDEAFRQRMRQEREALDRKLENGQITEEQHQAMLRNLQDEQKAKRAAHRDQQREDKKRLLKAFNQQKNAQRAQAIIDSARAAVALIPGYAWLGPGATAAAAASAATALATQLIIINRQQPPEFPMGGSVAERFATSADHQVISARLDEGIVSPRGMALIGPDGLDQINAGAGATASAIYLQVSGRTMAEASVRHGGRAQLRPVAGRVSGRAPVYGRG